MANRIRRLYSGGAKFEEYWIDAAWNGQSADSENTFDGTWADEIGNWEFKKDIHPDPALQCFKDGAGSRRSAYAVV